MPNVVREDLDNLNTLLTVVVDRSVYEPKLNEELKKYRQKASIKGFRKGKTPMSFIKKSFGQSVFADIINQQLQGDLNEYLNESKLDYLGQPLPATDQEEITLDVKTLQEQYVFKFELGLTPDFELQGADESTTLEMYDVTIPEEAVQEELDLARRRHGERQEVEDAQIEENDIVKMHVKELDGDALKEGGWESDMSILVNRIADEAVKEEILTKKKGDTLRLNVFTIEPNETEAYAKRYLLNMTEEDIEQVAVGEFFEGTITEVLRIIPAELNAEFFKKQFGEDTVSNEEEARAKIQEDIKTYYNRQTDGLLFRDIQENLMEVNAPNMPLPEAFLKRWLVASDERNTEDIVEKDFENFSKSLRWSIIRNKLQEKFQIQLEEADLRQGFADRIRQYMGGFSDASYIESVVDRMMQDQKQVENLADEIFSDRLFESLKATITVKEKPVSVEEFMEIVEAARAEAEAARITHAYEEE